MNRLAAERRAKEQARLRILERNKEIARRNAERDAKINAHNAKHRPEMAQLNRENRKISISTWPNARSARRSWGFFFLMRPTRLPSPLAFWLWAKDQGYA